MSVSDRIELVALTGEPGEVLALQRVIAAAPRFALAVTGLPPGPGDAQSMFTVLPEGTPYDDKFVYGVCLGGQMIGCADVVRGYPDPSTAFIGLLLIAEDSRRRGCGTTAYQTLESVILGWDGVERIRLSVVESNPEAVPFWRSVGFEPTGETKPYRRGGFESRQVLFEKVVRSAD
jgi:ribosomal protein S18 acetylase RimI-like enzyme